MEELLTLSIGTLLTRITIYYSTQAGLSLEQYFKSNSADILAFKVSCRITESVCVCLSISILLHLIYGWMYIFTTLLLHKWETTRVGIFHVDIKIIISYSGSTTKRFLVTRHSALTIVTREYSQQIERDPVQREGDFPVFIFSLC